MKPPTTAGVLDRHATSTQPTGATHLHVAAISSENS
jgi:hypothetical protein